jgi:hypothetical protein
MRERKQETDIGKYSFVNRIIKNLNQLQKRWGLSLVNLTFLERDLGKHL